MRPPYALLWVSGSDATDGQLRALARLRGGATGAAHISRSYRAPFALVAWHEHPLGVDIEQVTATDRSFAESICTPAELTRFEPLLDDDAFVSSLWCGKEALAKALGDAVAYDPRRLDSPHVWDGGTCGEWRAWEFIPCPGHVAWLVWREQAQNSAASASSADSTRRLAGRR